MGRPVPMCPIRIGEACSLCSPGATGPEDCGLVWLVMNDPDLKERLGELRRELHRGAELHRDGALADATGGQGR